MTILKKTGFNPLFRRNIFQKITSVSQIEVPSCFRVKGEVTHAETPFFLSRVARCHFITTKYFAIALLFTDSSISPTNFGSFMNNVLRTMCACHLYSFFSKVYLKVLVKQQPLVQYNPWYLFGFFIINLSPCFSAAQSNAGCNLLRWKQVFYYHIMFLFLFHSKNQTVPLKNCLQIAAVTWKIFICRIKMLK